MSWLKPSVYIIGLLIVLFGGALLLDLAAPMLGLQHWLPNRQHTQQQVERQYQEMWSAIGQQPPDSTSMHNNGHGKFSEP